VPYVANRDSLHGLVSYVANRDSLHGLVPYVAKRDILHGLMTYVIKVGLPSFRFHVTNKVSLRVLVLCAVNILPLHC
jgi:hypothetical protein